MSSLAGITAQPIRFHPPKTPLQYGVRETPGRFNRLRWATVGLTQALFFSLCWASWQGRPLVGFDFSRQQIHLFGAILGPQDLFLLALLLIAGALALFAVSAIAGRLFCGFACPQTVYTAVFLWIEQRLQGSPGQRQRRVREGARVQAGLRRAATWGAWGVVSLWIGWTLVAYFSPAPDLWARTLQADLGPWELFGLLFYGGFTFLQAGLLREKVCQHMCPYARFQGVMGNARTLNVSYDAPRGEPRTRPAAQASAQAADSKAGACIDCGLCVDVCPAGIDIRQGAQYECISCGLCIDACDRVMTRTCQPTGLIRFASLGGDRLGDVLRQPRIRVYGVLLLAALLGVALLALQRIPLQLDVLRDRGVLARVDRQGGVENLYRLHLQNYDTAAHDYAITVCGLPGLRVETSRDTRIASGEGRTLVVSVQAPAQDTARGIAPLQFTVQASGDNRQQRTRASTFLFPH